MNKFFEFTWTKGVILLILSYIFYFFSLDFLVFDNGKIVKSLGGCILSLSSIFFACLLIFSILYTLFYNLFFKKIKRREIKT